ncbi:hypothetical protein AA0616_2058 [Komagataeibacter nataicola NRIC 0616]|nr:hypothetical protein AA0616_2058 [Komagataeibacter nataicola NRIC 0616]
MHGHAFTTQMIAHDIMKVLDVVHVHVFEQHRLSWGALSARCPAHDENTARDAQPERPVTARMFPERTLPPPHNKIYV